MDIKTLASKKKSEITNKFPYKLSLTGTGVVYMVTYRISACPVSQLRRRLLRLRKYTGIPRRALQIMFIKLTPVPCGYRISQTAKYSYKPVQFIDVNSEVCFRVFKFSTQICIWVSLYLVRSTIFKAGKKRLNDVNGPLTSFLTPIKIMATVNLLPLAPPMNF